MARASRPSATAMPSHGSQRRGGAITRPALAAVSQAQPISAAATASVPAADGRNSGWPFWIGNAARCANRPPAAQ
ncbi:Uncharacterised protein [Achromobacter xylosoxidans]|nr:Uncharacterised protein [Achromobacter xylosoxidans]